MTKFYYDKEQAMKIVANYTLWFVTAEGYELTTIFEPTCISFKTDEQTVIELDMVGKTTIEFYRDEDNIIYFTPKELKQIYMCINELDETRIERNENDNNK